MPAYEYPGGPFWDAVPALPPGSIVVFDPADGPGDALDPTYVTAVAGLRSAGIEVFGYVTAGYGKRNSEEMIGEVERHEQWYGPAGIFLDQTPPAATADRAIVAAIEHVRAKRLRLAINPGQPDIDPEDAQVADHVVNFEGPLAAYRRARFPVWTADLPPERLWHLVHGVGDVPSLRAVLTDAVRHRAGVVFVTDATMPNPWGTLPAYWEDELRLVGRRAAGG